MAGRWKSVEGESDRHGDPGWLAASGIACRLGQHWPAAALSTERARHRRSDCADCGKPMERMADGRWRSIGGLGLIGAGLARSR